MVKYCGHHWYNTILSYDKGTGVLDKYTRSELRKKFTVCGITVDNKRLFGVFDSFLDYLLFIKKIDTKRRCYFEVMFGDFPCKPYFDIDIKNISELSSTFKQSCIEAIVQSIIQVFLNVLRITLDIAKDIRIYTSHGPAKYSFHVIVNNYCLANAVQARAFFDKVVEITDKKYTKYMDDSIYSSLQQFRLLGCRKLNTERVKILTEKITINNTTYDLINSEKAESSEHQVVIDMQESLVNFTTGCISLPLLILPKIYTPAPDITDKMAQQALDACEKYLNIKWDDPDCSFSFRDNKEGKINLNRNHPSFCKICERTHEHETAYLFVRDNRMYFRCRRKRLQPEFIGFFIEEPIFEEAPILKSRDIISKLSECAMVAPDIPKKVPRKPKIIKSVSYPEKALSSNTWTSSSYVQGNSFSF